MRDHLKDDDGPYGHTIPELRQGALDDAARQIELDRAKRRGLIPKARKRRKPEAYDGLHAAFARAAEEQREFRR